MWLNLNCLQTAKACRGWQGFLIKNYYYYYYYYYYLLIRVFHISFSWWSSTGVWVIASHFQVSNTLLGILVVLNNAVVWIVSTRPPTSKSSTPFNNLLVTVPKTPITIGIIVTFMFHSFFNSLARSRYLYFFSYSFSFILWPAGTAKSTMLQILLFLLLIIIRSGLLAKIMGSVCMSKSHRSFCVSFSRDRCWIVHIPFFRI